MQIFGAMARTRSKVFALLVVAAYACVAYGLLGHWRAGASDFLSPPRAASRGLGRVGHTRLAARGGDAATLAPPVEEEENETITIKGFSSLLVGLALLPYVVCTLKTVFDVTFGGKAFDIGPYGLVLVACLTTVCVTFWSVGSYVQRGRGLPAGPFGLLGLAEGFSYIGTVGLAIAIVATSVAGSKSVPPPPAKAPEVKAAASKAVEVKAPAIKVPEVKAPEIKVPEIKAPKVDFKAPEIKVPEIKVPEIKAPKVDFKAPEIKVPEIKKPEIKVPEVKAPELPKPKAPEAAPKPKAPETPPKPAPAPEAKKAPAPAKVDAADDYSDLFN